MDVVLDSIILLHYRNFEDIPWSEETGSDNITIALTAMVIEEMREMMVMGGMDIIDKPAVGFEKEQIEKELEEWNREGRQRYLTELITTMVRKEEGAYSG